MRWRHFLLPFALIYGGIASIRRLSFERWRHTFHASIATICVGNLAVGGTGKTPHVAMIAQILSRHFHVALLSRGYRRRASGFVLADMSTPTQLDVDSIGDEPMLLHLRFPHLPIAADADRKGGILEIQRRIPDTEVIILDDALQHLAVVPSCRILLTEYHRPYSDDWPMPAGSLREFRSAARVADIVIVTKTDMPKESIRKDLWRRRLQLEDRQYLFFTRYLYDPPQPVTPLAQALRLSADTTIILLTGIAHPEPLHRHLLQEHPNVRHLKYSDHHRYTKREIRHVHKTYFDRKNKVALFTTEKDWMRLRDEKLINVVSLLPVFVISIRADFVFEEDEKLFNNIIESHVRRKIQKN